MTAESQQRQCTTHRCKCTDKQGWFCLPQGAAQVQKACTGFHQCSASMLNNSRAVCSAKPTGANAQTSKADICFKTHRCNCTDVQGWFCLPQRAAGAKGMFWVLGISVVHPCRITAERFVSAKHTGVIAQKS